MIFIRAGFCFSLLLICFLLPAQPRHFTSLTVNDGLTQNSVYDIQFDKHGFMWVATADGLNRYDGYTFVQYRKSGDPKHRLFNTSIHKITCDDAGHVWIAGSQGIEVLDTRTDSVHWVLSSSALIGQQHWVNYGDHVYLFMQHKGVLSFNAQTMKQESLTLKNERGYDSAFHHLSSITVLSNILLFPRSANFYYRFQPLQKKLEKETLFTDGSTLASTAAQKDSGTVFLLFKKSNEMFLGEYDLRKKSMLKKKRIHMGNPDPFYKALIHIPSLQQLVVTDQEKGLVFFDYDFEETAQYPTHTILGSSSKEIIFHHASLKDNCLWMSTDPFGVIQCSLSDKPFYHFKPSRKTAVTKGIFTDAEGNVYGALLNEGLVKFDKNGNEMPELESEKEPFQFQAFNTIFSIAPDSVFIHCFNYLGYYNTRAKAFNNFKPYFLQATKSDLNLSFYNQSVRIRGKEFLTSSDRKLWYLHFSEKDLKVKLVSEFPHPISAICSSKDGTFLVGTIQGLYVWKKNKIEFIEPIGTRFIKHILQDGHGHFWISTIDGLWLLDENLKVMKAFSTQNGLLNNFIYGTVESNQEIWGSSNYGLFRIDPAHEKISTYQITDGLQSNEFNSGTFFKSHDGKIFFGGINGINLINDHFQKNFSAEFNTVITSLKINDHADSTRAPWTLTNLHLPHEKNTLSFSFAGLFPSQSDRLIYRYKMQGSDRDWVYSGKERTARYASLSPGSYQFKVAASMNGEDWKSESIVSIFIAPPFWLTWWFRAFLVIALAIIIAGIVRLIQHRKVKREIEKQKLHLQLEEERQRISRDLHDNMGAYTSALLSNVQQMQQKTDETFAKDLAHMQQNAEQILSSLRETIWVLNNKSISVQDFADAFKSNCLKLLRSFQGIHLDAQEHITTSYILSAPTAIHLNKILMEAVQNTLKHAQAKNIIVIIHCGEQLLIEIKDDGVGFETERGTGNGLHNMEWRASQAGFRFQFFSEKGKGTRIELVKNIGSEKI